jgi:GR25 family glycosyltransferase involved in LPS biosynthesis
MNVLNQYFDKVYVITSYFHKPRIQYINELFKKENIKFDFHYAVHPDFLSDSIVDDYIKYLEYLDQKDTLPTSKYRVSATISHLQVLRQFQYSGYNNVLIFEDDVSFEIDYQNKLKIFIDNVHSDWDILNLGRNYTYEDSNVQEYNQFVNIPKDLYGAHAYAFSKNRIEEFCEYLEKPHQLPWGPDPHYVKMYKEGYKCYCPSEFIFGALSTHFKDSNFVKAEERFDSLIS